MFAQSKSIIFCILLSASLLAGAGTEASLDQKKMSQAIFDAYSKQMNAVFLQMVNISKTSKNQSEFFQRLLAKPFEKAAVAKLDQQLGSVKVPQILAIKDGIEFTIAGKKTNISLTSKLGVLLIDGQEVGSVYTAHGDGRANKFSLYIDLLESQAQAGLLRKAGEAVSDLLETNLLSGAISFKEKVAIFSKGSAAIAAVGAATGCGVGLLTSAYSQDGKALDNCAVAAALGAVGFPISAVGSGMLAGGVIASNEIKIFAKVASAPQFIKDVSLLQVIGTLGAAALVTKAFEPQIYSNGGQIVCESSRGEFSYGPADFAKTNNGNSYTVSSDRCDRDVRPCFKMPLDKNDIAKNIKAYDQMPEESKKAVVDAVMTDLEEKVNTCKKHGVGYTEKFLFSKNATTKGIETKAPGVTK